MNLFRKFYDTAEVAEPAGGVMSAAEAMAKGGYKSGGEYGDSNRPPVHIQEEPKQETTNADAATAIVSAETKVEDVKETPKPTEVETAVAKETVATEPQKTISWQEVLKQQQPDTVFKEYGFDDTKIGFLNRIKEVDPKMVAFLDVWESGGDVSAYLKELTTDYSKMSSEDLMRHQLRNEYPKASEKQIDILFKKEVIDAYGLDPDKYSEEEVEEGKELLSAKADKYRDAFIERQQGKLLPPPPEAKSVEVDNSQQEEIARFEERKAYVSNDPFIKNMFATNKFTIGQGEEAFNYPIDPKEINGILFDAQKWAEAINEVNVNGKGERVIGKPKVEHQALVSLVAKYGKDFLNAYAEHFKTIGSKKAIEPIENAKPPEGQSSAITNVKPDTAAGAMAKYGTLR